ncbi:uncharacterized protein LOC132943943 [Metopolophium dirhodum]|uniref:uncharacterized protein LOC132943943 n=1 Tax=Metopolophium dirhodum TaxID=44670 RepID=UPI00298F7C19|nr:uncharacterized protein LOC132943943 [Metopolophium dirhodum]
MTLDKIRLLHAELSDLLRIFSAGYGQMLVGFFVFNYINTLLSFYYMIHYNSAKSEEFTFTYFLKTFIICMASLQNVTFILSIIIAASRVHDKVKLFINQISIFESDEITAFGIFNINLNLVVSILVLLITGLITLIQLKEHPFIKQSVGSMIIFIQNTSKGTFK